MKRVFVILKTLKTGIILPRGEKPAESHHGGLNAYSLSGLGIGGVIGAGFFLGSGLAVREAGPSVSLAFLIGGIIMMQVLGAMTSINVNRLEHGSFRVYVEQFLGSYAGFLVGWAVFISSILGIGSEAIAMGVFVHYWLPHIPLPVWAMLFMIIIVLLNAMNMENFGRMENETYESKLIWGRPGAYATISAILVLFIMSLRVHDFLMGFYAAFSFIVIISVGYFIWTRQHLQHN